MPDWNSVGKKENPDSETRREVAELTQSQLDERLTSAVPLRDSELEPEAVRPTGCSLTLTQRKGLCFLLDKSVCQSVYAPLLCLCETGCF